MAPLPRTTTPMPFRVAGLERTGEGSFEVHAPADGSLVARVSSPTAHDVEQALTRAHGVRRAWNREPVRSRKRALEHLRDSTHARADEFAREIAIETGKPLVAAHMEVARAIETFDLGVAECSRPIGEVLPVDAAEQSENHLCLWRRQPVGVVTLITPFNFPLNLVAHKIAPALAAGCPFLLKPALETAPIALALGDLLAQCDLPPGVFSILPATDDVASPFVDDARVALLSFTGSAKAGWHLARRAAGKRVLLELGGVAACIVDEGSDVAHVAARLVAGAFGQAGQSCISVQRILVHESLRNELERRLVELTRALVVGPPLDATSDLGPVLRDRDAERIESWIAGAVRDGARLLCGGGRRGRFVEPTIVVDAPQGSELVREEVFGPVATLESFSAWDDALARLDTGRGGLHVGLFTKDWERALRAFEDLDVGGVVLGDVPTVRAEAMPYGGRGASGLMREGVRFAVDAMTEPKALLVRRPNRA